MTGCLCNKLNTTVKVCDHQSFFKVLNEIDVGNWVRLMEYRICDQLWAVAEWDKYQTQLATKIPPANRHTWQEFNITSEKEFLLQNRGGVTSEPCAWAHCDKPRVVGVAFCIDHLYQTGARE